VCGSTSKDGPHETCVSTYVASMHGVDLGVLAIPHVDIALDTALPEAPRTSRAAAHPLEHVARVIHTRPPFKIPVA
jgi:hypothetical protein